MKNKVVSINRGRLLGAHNYAHNRALNPVASIYVAGFIPLVELPQIILSIYGGIIPSITFAVSSLIGSTLGLILYRYFPYRQISLFDTRAVIRHTPSKAHTRKYKDVA